MYSYKKADFNLTSFLSNFSLQKANKIDNKMNYLEKENCNVQLEQNHHRFLK